RKATELDSEEFCKIGCPHAIKRFLAICAFAACEERYCELARRGRVKGHARDSTRPGKRREAPLAWPIISGRSKKSSGCSIIGGIIQTDPLPILGRHFFQRIAWCTIRGTVLESLSPDIACPARSSTAKNTSNRRIFFASFANVWMKTCRPRKSWRP